MKRDCVDLFYIEPQHQSIHARLLNWASWVALRPHYATSPMFKAMGYRSNSRQWHAPQIRDTVDTLDALAVEKTMRHLPQKHRLALQYFYIYPFIFPHRVCKAFGLTKDGLAKHIRDGRLMVVANVKSMM